MKLKRDTLVRRKMLASVFMLLPLIAACAQSGGNESKTALIDPPPSAVEEAMLRGAETSVLAQNREMLTVYLLDRNGYVAPMTMNLGGERKTSRTMAEEAIAWMTADTKTADQLPAGFAAPLPQGTVVKSVEANTENRTVTIDFSNAFPGQSAGNERRMLEALVWTMTELPGIDKVKITVAGNPLRTLPSSGTPVYDELTRAIGINLEHDKDVNMNRSMGVTLYFSAVTPEGAGYFIPVTRLIERQQDRARAALEQLIKGPLDRKGLKPVLTTDMTVEQLSQLADTVDVSLRDSDWEPKAEIPAEMMEALVLTMTEATGAPQVRVVMNGSDAFRDTNGVSYDRPVTRPVSVNVLAQ